MKAKLLFLIKRSLIIVGIIFLFSLLFNWISPHAIPLITKYKVITIKNEKTKIPLFISKKKEKTKKTTAEDVLFHPAEEINLSECLQHFANGSALFLDARANEDYKQGHIPGSINIPIEEISIDEISLTELDLDQKIIAYCDGVDCTLSIDLSMYLEEMGFIDVFFFLGGWLEWVEAGYQISEGERP